MPNNKLARNKVAVIGIGLIGGSFAAALKQANPAIEVIAVARNAETCAKALAMGIADRAVENIAAIAPELGAGDTVLIAVPTLSVQRVLAECAESLDPEVTITDGASVKGAVLNAMIAVYGHAVPQVVLGHPIAGSEKSGITATNPALFQNHLVILTPTEANTNEHLNRVNLLWSLTGAEVTRLSVQEHDHVLAATSHLPHLIAYSMVETLAGDPKHDDIFRYAAGGFRDFSRIAASDPTMWHDIMLSNGDAIVQILDNFSADLQKLRTAVVAQDGEYLRNHFTRAKAARDHFSEILNQRKRVTSMSQAMNFIANPGSPINGRIRVPGDKSMSHRSIMLGALAEGVTRVSGFLEGEDALCTLSAFKDMGVEIDGPVDGQVTVHGVGLRGLKAPENDLNMGNSGTSMRLLSGIVAGQQFSATLTGDASLTKRPMNRVANPLREMGVEVNTQHEGRPPITINGTGAPNAIDYVMPMASAQVKSCVLLAGLFAQGTTSVVEPAPTRDHTERMLRGFGYEVITQGNKISLAGGGSLTACDIDVPADISSAAFFMVAAAIMPGSDLTLEHVGINPTRIGVINILQAMGANLSLMNEREVGGEPVADIRIRYAPLRGIEIPQDQVPLAIDEFPVLFVAAACAQGKTILTGAQELRVKESDRIQVMADGLVALGVAATPTPDGMIIEGGPIGGGEITTHHDHRIAMSFAVASLRSTDTIKILDCAHVATSFPGFSELANSVGFNIDQELV